MLLNIFHDDGVSFFGDLTVYTRGFMQALLHNEQDVAMLPVEQQPPPAGREYIHSMMYWMAIGNHVVTIQSRSLTTKHLEQYLTWLLAERTQQMRDNGQVLLTAKSGATLKTSAKSSWAGPASFKLHRPGSRINQCRCKKSTLTSTSERNGHGGNGR